MGRANQGKSKPYGGNPPPNAALTLALRRAFLHLRFCMLAARTIENEYLRNTLDVQDGADKLHWLLAMA